MRKSHEERKKELEIRESMKWRLSDSDYQLKRSYEPITIFHEHSNYKMQQSRIFNPRRL